MFIYVFDIKARDTLHSHGFSLLKADEVNDVYIFCSNPNIEFAFNNINYALSNTLTF